MRRDLRVLVLGALGALGVACGGSAAPGGAAAPTTTTTEGQPKAEPTVIPVETRMLSAQGELEDAQSAFTAAGSDCASLCKALASMTRATDHLCELAKEAADPKRCDDAKGRLDSAQAKVKSTCGGCG